MKKHKGYNRQIRGISRLLFFGKRTSIANLDVADWHTGAIRSYEKAGFGKEINERIKQVFNNLIGVVIKMEYVADFMGIVVVDHGKARR